MIQSSGLDFQLSSKAISVGLFVHLRYNESYEETEMLNLHRILQYNCPFDKGNRSQVFFPEAS
jgi:hypothetical protein